MSMIDLMISIVGQPTNDVEYTMLYMVCCMIALMFFYSVPYLFKLVANTIKNI